MEINLSYASMAKIQEALAEMTAQAERGEEPEVVMGLDGPDGEPVRVRFIDEANEEFAEPSASVSR